MAVTTQLHGWLHSVVGVATSSAVSSSSTRASDVADNGSTAVSLLLRAADSSPKELEAYLFADAEAQQLVETALGPHPNIGGRWRPTSSQSEIQFRTLSLLAALARLREAYQDSCNARWRLGDRLRALVEDDSDPLALMAALSLVQEIGSTTWGLALLTANGTLALLEPLLADPLLTGQTLSVVCALLQVHPQLPLPPSIMQVVEQELESGSSYFGLALIATAIVAAGVQSQLVLDNSAVMARFASLCSSSRPAAIIEPFLNALNVHLRVPNVGSALFDRLAEQADESPLRMAMAIACRRGREELRLLALNLLDNLVRTAWGAALAIEFPGFFDFIIDRSTESAHDGMHVKYRVVRTLFDSHRLLCEDFFDVSEMDQLHAFLVEGAVFVPKIPATVLVADDTN